MSHSLRHLPPERRHRLRATYAGRAVVRSGARPPLADGLRGDVLDGETSASPRAAPIRAVLALLVLALVTLDERLIEPLHPRRGGANQKLDDHLGDTGVEGLEARVEDLSERHGPKSLRGFATVPRYVVHAIAEDVHERLTRAVKHRERRGRRVRELHLLRARRLVAVVVVGVVVVGVGVVVAASCVAVFAIFVYLKRRTKPARESLALHPRHARHPRAARRALHRGPAPARQPPQRRREERRAQPRGAGQKAGQVRRRREPRSRASDRVGDAPDELVHDPRAQHLRGPVEFTRQCVRDVGSAVGAERGAGRCRLRRRFPGARVKHQKLRKL